MDENYEHLFEESDGRRHDKLLEKVLKLNKSQNLKKPSRTEPTLQISEFNLVKSSTGKRGLIQLSDLTKTLKNKKSRVKIGHNLKKFQKITQTLPKPLEKIQVNKIHRGVGYERARLDLDRWEATVTSNRASTNLSFPLNNDFKMDKQDSTKMWRVKSKLQEKLDKLQPEVEEFTINLKEKEKFPLTMKEMLARRREAAKLRAYQGYQEAKARRQSKIKSKKYHRIQKKERIKKKLREFEQLQKTNPEAALKKLAEIEKYRAQERFSLRHKGTGKWARNQQIRAKYDRESRQNLAQQLTLSRDLTQKAATETDSEEDVEEVPHTSNDDDNIWINGIKPGKEVTDFISGYRKFWLQQNEQPDNNEVKKDVKPTEISENLKKKKKCKNKLEAHMLKNFQKSQQIKQKIEEMEEDFEHNFDKTENKLKKQMLKNFEKLKERLQVEKANKKNTRRVSKLNKHVDLTMALQKKTPQIDDELLQSTNNLAAVPVKNDELSRLKEIISSEIQQKEANIDPEKYLQIATSHLATAIPDVFTEDNEVTDQKAFISEAFEDDDIVEDFNKEKQNEVDKDKPKDINLTLPGWGSWGGTNIPVSTRKKRRFIVKAPKKVPRRDDNRGHLIINEKSQNSIKEHMVSEVPFPFKTVKDFEASIRAPISNTFVTETAFRKLIKPAVITKMGAIIEPIHKDLLICNK